MRTVLAFLAVMAATTATPGKAAETGRMVFDVYRDGAKIGTHRFDFRREGECGFAVDIAIDLKVGFGPITLYRYRHRNETVWADGRLQRMDAHTYDDGDEYHVAARAETGGLRVESSAAKSYLAPADALPSTYWMKETTAQSRLINTQNGELAEVTIAAGGAEKLATPVSLPPARRYEMSGDVELTLWYDSGERLAKLAFMARGEDITYKLVERAGFVPASIRPSDGRFGT